MSATVDFFQESEQFDITASLSESIQTRRELAGAKGAFAMSLLAL